MATIQTSDRGGLGSGHVRVITASSIGTMFEWYDFYLYGSLAANIAAQFFTKLDPTSGLIMALLAFAAGFAVRPFGALAVRSSRRSDRPQVHVPDHDHDHGFVDVPGRLDAELRLDRSRCAGHSDRLRLLQGLALGGEYGGAATYVAEHAPPGKRGFYTSFIQITATFGLFLSLIVILICKQSLGAEVRQRGAGAFRS